jgi:ribosome-binding factor A
MNNRVARVAELLRRELSRCIEREFEFSDVLVTIHEVSMTPDLRSAHVFVGTVGEESRRKEAIRKLNSRRNHLQSQVMKRVVLKYTPMLHFQDDSSVERGVKVVSLLDKLAEEASQEGEETGDLDAAREMRDESDE